MLAMALHNVSIVDVEDFTLLDDESSAEEGEDELVGDKRKRKAAKEEDPWLVVMICTFGGTLG